MDNQTKGNIGENFVNNLAYKSFMKYWCYPNPKYENGDKKEISDLLIIFKDVCIIFSVKNYEFKGNHKRYFNNTIEKAIRQLNGAHKTLFKNENVKIKHPNRKEEKFPKQTINKIFKIIINLGEGLDFYDLSKTSKNEVPITVFDKETFSIILDELDTIPDFIDYLEKREQLFNNKDVKVFQSEIFDVLYDSEYSNLKECNNDFIYINGAEKDLLSYFLKSSRNFPEAIKENNNGAILDIRGSWEDFKYSSKNIKKKAADKISYFVDEFLKNEVLNNDYIFKEDLAKELLSLNRLKRRMIGDRFFEFFFKIKEYKTTILHRRFLEFEELGIVFFNYFDNYSNNDIEKLFDIIFETFAYHYRYKHTAFILIGINKTPNFIYKIFTDFECFSLDDEKIIEHNIKELGWFTNYNENSHTENEFPN